MPGHSCLSALLDVFDNIMHMFDSNSSVNMVYFDFLIMWTMASFCITGNIGIWFFHFVTDTSHFERLPGRINDVHPVLTGVAQGTILDLFLIMISDIDKDVSASKLISFINDTRLYSGVGDVTVYDWVSSNNIIFN